ncbi:MAG: 4Fe-4S dicluster domain-containing protein, partial [Muribaculaceae bacterium]|nr:4Fe-4S dicluster domain-containing protein [Muribaculaceae bacterium]
TYTFVTVHRVVSAMIFVIASITFVVVALFAWFTGRGYCNEICPVGTILGFLSRYSWLKPVIDGDKCNGCHSCERHCKSKCIDSANKAIDYSRCVACMDCIGSCRQKAISFRHPSKAEAARKVSEVAYVKPVKNVRNEERMVDSKRRAFLATTGLVTGAFIAKAAEKAVGKVTDGGLTPLKDKVSHPRKLRMVPPGAISQAHINQHCVGCQLCIEACPNGLLTPSTDIATLMQPVMDYTNDYCHPECTACSNICPAGVFHPLDEVAKSSWKIGTAVVDLDACLSANGTDSCGNCERHCPAGAITMAPVSENDSRLMPVINETACIGCGACEFNCPVGSVASMTTDMAAIHVEGVKEQHTI